MKTKKNFHSVPWKGDWAVRKEGAKRPISIHQSQAVAESKTRLLAKRVKAEAVFHNKSGRILVMILILSKTKYIKVIFRSFFLFSNSLQ